VTLVAESVERLVAFADDEVASGRLPALQLAVAREGEVVLRHTAGAAADARFTTYSVTKAVTAAVAWMHLSADQRVADVLPEFEDKPTLTVEHLLTHTAGFPRAPMSFEDGADPERRRARFRTWRLDWDPGTRMEYHPTSAHWVIATMVEAVTGQDFRQVVLERLIEPLGLAALRLGLEADQAPVLDVVHVGSETDRKDPLEADEEWLTRFNEPFVRAIGIPGAGAVSTAEDIALLYQHLLHDPKGLWDPDVLADGTGRTRNLLLDPWTGVPANRTLGLTVAGDDGKAPVRQFGKATGPRAFGASGLGGQIGWADPDSGLSFCVLTNGLDRDAVASFIRANKLSTYAARCV
jgi:CubicO group peptidase (beta-lactamase class C family)